MSLRDQLLSACTEYRKSSEYRKECLATHHADPSIRFRGGVKLAWLASLLFSLSANSAVHSARLDHSIYVCMQEDGGPLFTDRGCLHGPKLHLAPTNVYRTQPSEKQPDKTARAAKPNQASTAQHPARIAAQRRAQIQERQAACQKAQRGLDRLHTKRRKGYRLSESRSLDQLEEELHTQRKAAC